MSWVGAVKTPPYSVHLEKVVLGGILADPELIREVRGLVREGDAFFRSQHGLLYDVALKLYRKRKSLNMDRWVDEVTGALERQEQLAVVGGRRYLDELASAGHTRAATIAAAETVRDKALLRRLIDVVSESLSQAYGGDASAAEIIEKTRAKLDEECFEG
jgi:replicative DNA helicase